MTVLEELADTLLRAAAALEGTGDRIPLHHTKWAERFRTDARAVRLLSLSWRPPEEEEVHGER